MSVVECHEVTKFYKKNKALDRFNVKFQEDKITGLIGRNGAGKTTLLKMISGQLKPDSGDIKVFDLTPSNDLIVSANSILISDELTFLQEMTLTDILKMGHAFYENWDQELAEKLFSYFNLPEDGFHNQLSKGKKSAFNMIFGLASKASLTLFDEPTTGMDYSTRQDFYRALLKDYIKHPRTIIISSHLLNELEDLLEDLVLIDQGRSIMHKTIEEFREYAVKLIGQKEEVHKWINEEHVFYRKDIDSNQSSIVVKDVFSSSEKETLQLQGINISPVPPAELSMYLTNESEGGIDDVFK